MFQKTQKNSQNHITLHGCKKSALTGIPHVTSSAETPPALTPVWIGHEDSETQRTGLQQLTIRSCHGLAQICSFASGAVNWELKSPCRGVGHQSSLLLPQTQSTSCHSKASNQSQTDQPHHLDWVKFPLSKPSGYMVWNYLLSPKHKATVKEA